jgi:hypothetical protein
MREARDTATFPPSTTGRTTSASSPVWSTATLQGWIQTAAEWNEEAVRREAAESRRRAEAMNPEPAVVNAGDRS